MIIEVIGLSVDDVKQAELYGADRVELCQSIQEDGLTPSYGLIKLAVEAVEIPINVMVRPHNDSFVYDKSDLLSMCEDIRAIKSLGANGIVIGPLTEEGPIDEAALQMLLAEAEGLDVTFHRAFDFVRDQKEALETLLKYEQIMTILTAGGKKSVLESTVQLQELMARTKNTYVTIMPGSGLRIEKLAEFYQEVQPQALHFGSGVRIDHSYMKSLSEGALRKIKEIIG